MAVILCKSACLLISKIPFRRLWMPQDNRNGTSASHTMDKFKGTISASFMDVEEPVCASSFKVIYISKYGA